MVRHCLLLPTPPVWDSAGRNEHEPGFAGGRSTNGGLPAPCFLLPVSIYIGAGMPVVDLLSREKELFNGAFKEIEGDGRLTPR